MPNPVRIWKAQNEMVFCDKSEQKTTKNNDKKHDQNSKTKTAVKKKAPPCPSPKISSRAKTVTKGTKQKSATNSPRAAAMSVSNATTAEKKKKKSTTTAIITEKKNPAGSAKKLQSAKAKPTENSSKLKTKAKAVKIPEKSDLLPAKKIRSDKSEPKTAVDSPRAATTPASDTATAEKQKSAAKSVITEKTPAKNLQSPKAKPTNNSQAKPPIKTEKDNEVKDTVCGDDKQIKKDGGSAPTSALPKNQQKTAAFHIPKVGVGLFYSVA